MKLCAMKKNKNHIKSTSLLMQYYYKLLFFLLAFKIKII